MLAIARRPWSRRITKMKGRGFLPGSCSVQYSSVRYWSLLETLALFKGVSHRSFSASSILSNHRKQNSQAMALPQSRIDREKGNGLKIQVRQILVIWLDEIGEASPVLASRHPSPLTNAIHHLLITQSNNTSLSVESTSQPVTLSAPLPLELLFGTALLAPGLIMLFELLYRPT